ncbi:glycosyltransferase [Lentzea albida]|uniref:UDP:flavonoid glycosyltransferase YjiC, YdhE family n=1 Tax=Lentzea albida TaxID=65499 RepID=A0A1H9HE41_9PSEU|nr:glycosyltransferase [Lentzea albida]SEQ60476.1 UDP:flavonoid glycosyltransferase YjiC, YdhE family [Lentzea albida]
MTGNWGVGKKRVVLAGYGSRGDVEPLIALAVALRDQGADVRVCVPPDEEFVARLAEHDVVLVPFGQSVRDLVTSTRPDPPAVAAALVNEWFGPVAAAAEGADVLVATGLMPAGARSVAGHLGLRYVLAMFHDVSLPSPHRRPSGRPGKPLPPDETDNEVLWRIDAENVNAMYAPALNENRAALGLPPVGNVRDHVYEGALLLAADPVLWPAADLPNLRVEQTGAWFLPDERPLAPDLVAFLEAGEPPVYAGFGSMAMHASKDLAQTAVDAIRSSGRRVLLGSGWAGLAKVDDSDDCFVVGEVNQQALFRRVAAVVHHGGAGTTTTAARAGAPQVIVPQIVDQPFWARRVAELGIGAAHDGPVPTVESLSAALRTALAPETRVRAAAVAGEIRTDGAERAARFLLDG